MLRGFWYPATLSERVAKRGLLAVQLLGEPLAIGRDPAGRALSAARSPRRAWQPVRKTQPSVGTESP